MAEEETKPTDDVEGYKHEYGASDDCIFVTIDGAVISNLVAPLGEEPLPGNLNIYKLVDGASQVGMVNCGDLPEDARPSGDDISGLRFIGIRAPIMIGGWGYDTEGDHVLGDTDTVIKRNKLNLNKWKYGPLDLRWDNDRLLWVAGTGGGRAKFLEFVDGEGGG